MNTQPEALRLADALDAEFVQGRISNSTGRKSAVELRRLALKQWVGLTDEEINSVRHNRDWTAPWTDVAFARAIEAKLREKNHG
jgi:hydroxymethylglutaryl-CoA reductase